MTAAEMFKRVDAVKAKYEDSYMYLGIRFEDKQRSVGELIADYSKSNCERDDDRDFPAYGTSEYEEMEELSGVCAYGLDRRIGWNPLAYYHKIEDVTDVKRRFLANHCYILGCNSTDYGEDENEIIMENAEVLDIIF